MGRKKKIILPWPLPDEQPAPPSVPTVAPVRPPAPPPAPSLTEHYRRLLDRVQQSLSGLTAEQLLSLAFIDEIRRDPFHPEALLPVFTAEPGRFADRPSLPHALIWAAAAGLVSGAQPPPYGAHTPLPLRALILNDRQTVLWKESIRFARPPWEGVRASRGFIEPQQCTELVEIERKTVAGELSRASMGSLFSLHCAAAIALGEVAAKLRTHSVAAAEEKV